MEILTAAYLLPITGDPIADGAIVIDEDHIVDFGTKKDILSRYCSMKITDYPDTVIMPGLVNAHTHLDRSSLPPLKPEASYIPWLANWIKERPQTSAVNRRESILSGLDEALKSGTTCLGDVGNHTGTLETLSHTKMRLRVFPEVIGSTHEDVSHQFDSTLQVVDDIHLKNAKNLNAGIAPYSPYTLSKEMLGILSQHAASHKIPLKIHISESFTEMEFFFEAKGEIADILFPAIGWDDAEIPVYRNTPLQFLNKINLLKHAPILIGCLHFSSQDLELVKQTASKIAYCPRNNENFTLGIAPLKKWMEAGIPVGLGTEGRDTGSSLSLWDEMRSALQIHSRNGGAVTPEEVLKLATLGSARVLGMERDIGSLEKGKKADFIVVHLTEKTDAGHLYPSLIQDTTPDKVEHVFIDGHRVI
jgi:aminodeoxyfutalosine deaminase